MRSRLLPLAVLTSALLAAGSSSAALAHPPGRDGPPVSLEATRTGETSDPFDVHETGDVLHFSVTETAVATGDGIYMEESGRYRCTQVADVIRCRGVVEGTGEILGQAGTVRTRVLLTCNPAAHCEGRAVIKGVSGELADARGTATSSSSAGQATVLLRFSRI